MKRIISSALIIALTIGAAQAQTTNAGKQNGHNKEYKMAIDSLNLSADQKAHVKSIREDFKKQMADLKSKQLSAAEMRTRRRELHKQFESQFESILTPEQKSRLAELKAQHRQDRERTGQFKDGRNRRMHDNAFGRGQKFQQELGLTEEQQQKVSQIRADFKPKFEAVRSDSALAADQKRAKMHELKQQQHEQIKSVLTAEQIQKMQSLRKQPAENTK